MAAAPMAASGDPAQALSPGMSASIDQRIERQHTINRTGKPGADVLSTPAMIMLMEQAAIEAIDPHLAGAHVTVGFHVDVKHFAPTAIGATVTATAEITGIDGVKVSLSVAAFEGDKQIGAGSHRRAIISTED